MNESTFHAGMVGRNFYNHHSAPQRSAIDCMDPLVAQAVDQLPAGSASLCLCDYGCSEGRNSIALTDRVIQLLDCRSDPRAIMICRNDLPTNDFRSLIGTLQNAALRREFNCDRCFPATRQIRELAIRNNFFDSILPAESLDLGMSTSALHWLSQQTANGNQPACDPRSKRTETASRAESDWQRFLALRATELRPGGKLIISTLARWEGRESQSMPTVLLRQTASRYAATGKIASRVARDFDLPVYFRSPSELLTPLKSGTPLARRLKVNHFQLVVPTCPLYAKYEQTCNASEYARNTANFIRAFSATYVARELFGTNKISHSTMQRLDEFYGTLQTLVKEHPERYRRENPHFQLLLTRL